MKKDIHPAYATATITCACGESFEVGSTAQDMRVDVCSKCHPFYTGTRQRVGQAGGRVERFRRRYGLPDED